MRTPAERQLNRLARPFLRAIRAEPDNDLPRLVFADWLDERGDPFGEFIRRQCRTGKPETTVRVEWAYGMYGAFGGSPTRFLNPDTTLTFRRGFLDEIECHPTEWVRLRRRLRHPVRTVSLHSVMGVTYRSGVTPGFYRFRGEWLATVVETDGRLFGAETAGEIAGVICSDMSIVNLTPRTSVIRPLRNFNAECVVYDTALSDGDARRVRSVLGASPGASARPTLPNQ